MSKPTQRVQYPELNGSEQHHDLKNDPGKAGDPNHMDDEQKMRVQTLDNIDAAGASSQKVADRKEEIQNEADEK